MNPKGKTALVTGGAHRVGKAITMALAGAGANIVINYNTSSKAADATAAEVEALGVEALAVQANVANYQQVEKMVTAAKEKFGGIDILVNSASLWRAPPFPTRTARPSAPAGGCGRRSPPRADRPRSRPSR